MSVEPSNSLEPEFLYCTPKDVASYFEKIDSFDATTNPTLTDVKRKISGQSDYIDRITGHAWRPRRVVEETRNLSNSYRVTAGIPVSLRKRDIRTPLDPDKGDSLKLFRGNSENEGYEEMLTKDTFNFGRNNDYWIEESIGMLHIYGFANAFSRYRELKITYRYGKEIVPQAIKNITARLVAADYLEAQQYRITTPGNENAPDPSTIAERWREMSRERLKKYEEVRSTGL